MATEMTVIHAAIHTIVRMIRGRVRCLIMVRMSEKINDASQMYSSSLWQRRAVEIRRVYLWDFIFPPAYLMSRTAMLIMVRVPQARM